MKHLFKLVCLILFMSSKASYSQKIMNTVDDAKKIETNKELFVGKPFSTLLKEIGPEIKLVFAEGNRPDGTPGYIVFRFENWEEQKKYNKLNKKPTSITIFFKEKFEWNKGDKPLSERQAWTIQDAERLQNLTVIDIRVSGETLQKKK